MIGALLGWLLPVAGGFYLLGMLHGARQEQNADRAEPIAEAVRDAELAEGRANQVAGFTPHNLDVREQVSA